MTEHRRRWLLRWAGNLFILAGLVALACFGFAVARIHIFQAQAAVTPIKPIASLNPKDGALLGSMSIPRVGISSAIVEGDDDRNLALSVGHIPGTALPGRPGNVGLAGHRDTLFRGLRNIHDGDDILITTPSGNQVYEVESTRVVEPEDVYVLNDVGRPLLTLVTCYPFHYIGPAPKRFIVQAHPVDSDRNSADSALSAHK